MTLAAYNGHEALTFTDYLDLGTGKTLHAEPGRTYDIAPASGRVVPEFPEPWFMRVLRPTSGLWLGMARELNAGTPLVPVVTQPLNQAEYEEDQAGGEPAHDEDPETDPSQQF